MADEPIYHEGMRRLQDLRETRAIADRLAQPEGRWTGFDRSGLRRLIYPDPRRGARGRANDPHTKSEGDGA